ncbi:MAG: cation diffusion facilitator family transporter [Lachnospiraceae bacterium]|nr:cation diffusion facilitator family transporter [Lachnospiraceae bacterium]
MSRPNSTTERTAVIVRTSVVGILTNVLLAGFKAAIGILAGSIAIVLDAVNNLSDALSSLITIIGTKLAGKAPDKKHPLGHGRIEYITAMVIGVIILYAGVTSLNESIKKILNPTVPEYQTVGLIIIAVAVIVKILLGTYVRGVGRRVNSDSLIASGKDALNDAIISVTTLAAAIIFLTTKVSLEAYLGAIISLIIIKAGYDTLSDTISEILGARADSELTRGIKATISEFPEVSGAYDLILHNYGPDMLIGSVHVEVPDTMDAAGIDNLARRIQGAVYEKYGVILTAVGIYSVNTTNEEVMKLREEITRCVCEHEYVLQMHGFYLNEQERRIRFDVIIDFAAPDRYALYRHLTEDVQQIAKDYAVEITMDSDISD